MKGTEMVASELSPEISATIELEGPGVEWNFLKAVRDVTGGDIRAAAPGFVSKWQLRNPVASGVIGIVDLIEISTSNSGEELIFGQTNPPVTTDFATVLTPRVPDSRWGVLSSATLIWSGQNTNNTLTFANLGRSQVQAGDRAKLRRIVLLPGSHVQWGVNGLNIGASTTIQWHERQLPALEV